MSVLLDRRDLLKAALCVPAAFALSGAAAAGAQLVVRLETEDESQPISSRDKTGRYSGMVETAMDLIAHELGWSIEYATVPWKRAQQYLRQGTLDAFCTVPTDERRSYARFAAAPLFTLDSGWAHFAANNPRAAEIRSIRSMSQLQTFRIGLERGEAWPNDLFGGDWQTTEVEDAAMLANMALANHIDLFFEVPEIMLFLRRRNANARLGSVHLDFLPGSLVPYTFALRRSFPDAENLMTMFDQAHRRLSADGTIEHALAQFRV